MRGERWCRAHNPGLPHRGGPPKGNRNAVTHGLYARWFTADERQQLEDVAGIPGLTGEIAVLRVALARLLAAYAYDANGNQTGVTDATNRTTTYGYDAANRLTSVTDNGQHTTSYTLDADGQVTGVTDANTHTTTYTIDAAHRLTKVTDPHTATTTYAYDAANQLVTVTDANTHATS